MIHLKLDLIAMNLKIAKLRLKDILNDLETHYASTIVSESQLRKYGSCYSFCTNKKNVSISDITRHNEDSFNDKN